MLKHRLFNKKLGWSKKEQSNYQHWIDCYDQKYPLIPSDEQLLKWSKSKRIDYQAWINLHEKYTKKRWLNNYLKACQLKNGHKISIITPVYNPPIYFLEECLASVQSQTSPYWEWILVDDGSTNKDVLKLLNSGFSGDPRIKVFFSKKQQGISQTTNHGIDFATGNYIAFLDHDDRLKVNAVEQLHQAIIEQDYDILYSDRDLITLDDCRDFHLMKPSWSPETLLSGNYIFHLMCYKTIFIRKIGKLNSAFDGSQDYDLILRASEENPNVKHIPHVLYHWRQHEHSISKNESTKIYTFEAGQAALKATLERQKIKAKVQQHPKMPLGIYQLLFEPEPTDKIQIIYINPKNANYGEYINEQASQSTSPYLLILAPQFIPENKQTIEIMASWMQFKKIALISGKLVNEDDILSYAGMSYTMNGQLLYHYQKHHRDQLGYMNVTNINRNVSISNPYCTLIRRDVWQQLGGLNSQYKGTLSMLDFNFRVLKNDYRILYQPESSFKHNDTFNDFTFYQLDDAFKQQWQTVFSQPDPYYNPNLCQDCNEMGLGNH